MLNENAKKWVAALRSGKYKQGKGKLHDVDDKYCCLGIACKVAMENGVELNKKYNADDLWYTYDGKSTYLPSSVLLWLRLRNGRGGCPDYSTDLAAYNDTGITFNQIADIIEREHEDLFV
jgi:hypothetical protein